MYEYYGAFIDVEEVAMERQLVLVDSVDAIPLRYTNQFAGSSVYCVLNA